MRVRSGFTVVFAIALLYPSPGVTAAAPARHSVAVYLYNATALSLQERRAALEVASATLRDAGVDVSWLECGQRSSMAACHLPRAHGDLALRLVRSPQKTTETTMSPLGEALVDTSAGMGRLGTLFVDRVQRLARGAGVEISMLLGRAIAHEVGHLVVATKGHSKHGLMRAIWLRDEIRRNQPRDWAFGEGDISAIAAALRARLSPASVNDCHGARSSC